MPPRKTPRLAYSEYVVADPSSSTAVWMARLHLMRVVQRVYPAMLERLSDDVFPAYDAVAASGFNFDEILFTSSAFSKLKAVDLPYIERRTMAIALARTPSETGRKPLRTLDEALQCANDGDFNTYSQIMNERDAVKSWERRLRMANADPKAVLRNCSALRDSLEAWGKAFNANANWFLDETLRTLRGWYADPDSRARFKWNPISGVSSTLARGERLQFECEGWEMQLLTWADYSRFVRTHFEKKLAEYESANRQLAESCGLVRAPHKYSPDNFEWFALYQFAGLSSKRISDQITSANPSDPSTVLKGVKAAARLLGWTHLREPKNSDGKIRKLTNFPRKLR